MRRELLLSWFVAAPGLHAQPVPVRDLPRAQLEFPETFSAVSGLRELSDGRVIVADATERTLQLVDPQSRSTSPIGRVGGGPLEWQRPTRLYAIGGDTTLLYDAGNRRFLVLGPLAQPVRTMPQQRIESANGPNSTTTYTIVPRYIDTRGITYLENVVVEFDPVTMRPVAEDSVALLRVARDGRDSETVGWLRTPRLINSASIINGSASVSRAHPMAARDEWVAFGNGDIAIVRAKPYRVEWIARDGSRVTGPAIDVERLRISDTEKRAINERERQRARGSFSVTTASGAGDATPRQLQMPNLPDITEWPEFKPPFLAGGDNVWTAPNGELWVRRTQGDPKAGDLFDVFKHGGIRSHQVRLPVGARLVGFGKAAMYTAVADSFDVLTVRRHPLP